MMSANLANLAGPPTLSNESDALLVPFSFRGRIKPGYKCIPRAAISWSNDCTWDQPLDIPIKLYSVETLHFVGFHATAAQVIFERFEIARRDHPNMPIDFYSFMRDFIRECQQNVFRREEDWDPILLRMGLREDIRKGILHPDHDNIRLSKSARDWAIETVQDGWIFIKGIDSAIKRNKRKIQQRLSAMGPDKEPESVRTRSADLAKNGSPPKGQVDNKAKLLPQGQRNEIPEAATRERPNTRSQSQSRHESPPKGGHAVLERQVPRGRSEEGRSPEQARTLPGMLLPTGKPPSLMGLGRKEKSQSNLQASQEPRNGSKSLTAPSGGPRRSGSDPSIPARRLPAGGPKTPVSKDISTVRRGTSEPGEAGIGGKSRAKLGAGGPADPAQAGSSPSATVATATATAPNNEMMSLYKGGNVARLQQGIASDNSLRLRGLCSAPPTDFSSNRTLVYLTKQRQCAFEYAQFAHSRQPSLEAGILELRIPKTLLALPREIYGDDWKELVYACRGPDRFSDASIEKQQEYSDDALLVGGICAISTDQCERLTSAADIPAMVLKDRSHTKASQHVINTEAKLSEIQKASTASIEPLKVAKDEAQEKGGGATGKKKETGEAAGKGKGKGKGKERS